MTTEEPTQETAQETPQEIPKEPGQFLALLEKVEKQQRVLSETHVGHVQHLAATERAFEARFKQVERDIMELDVKLSGKVGKLDAKVGKLDAKVGKLSGKVGKLDAKVGKLDAKVDKLDAKIDALDNKLDAKVGALAIGIERIAAHLGLGQVIPAGPAG